MKLAAGFIVAIILLTLTACSGYLTSWEINKGIDLCKNNGGVYGILTGYEELPAKVTCNDGIQFKITRQLE